MPCGGSDWTPADDARRNTRRAEYALRLKIKYPHLHTLQIKRIVKRKIR